MGSRSSAVKHERQWRQQMNMSQTIYYPQTKADFLQITEWIALGRTNEEIFTIISDPSWRTNTIEFQGELFCDVCGRLIPKDYCAGCEQTI